MSNRKLERDIQEIDWTLKGVVAPVRNSGVMCSGSFAWSALGPI